jgi:hypothetical protein
MNKRQEHLEKIEELKTKIENHPSIEDLKKSAILEKIEEWKHDEDAMALIPNKLVELYEDDIKPVLVELGLI